MDALIGLISMLAFAICIVLLLVSLIRKTPKKKILIAMCVCIVCFYSAITWEEPNSNSNTSSSHDSNSGNFELLEGQELTPEDIASLPFGDVLFEELDKISAKDDISIFYCEVTGTNGLYTLRADTSGPRLWIAVKQSSITDEWSVDWIKNYDDNNYIYYMNERDKYTPTGLLQVDIYDFKTNDTVEKSDKAAVDAYYQQLEADRQAAQKEADKKKHEDAANLFHEIRVAYENNELSADDTYRGNRYTIIGAFDGAADDGLINELFSTVTVTVKIMDGRTTCYVFCSFDAKQWRTRLSKLDKGDEMIIEGECANWGSWSECQLKN